MNPTAPSSKGYLGIETPLPALNDPEGERIPAQFDHVIDAHVHIFPEMIFSAVRTWFGEHGWQIRYPLKTNAIIDFLLDRGVDHVVAFQYAHKPGMAEWLNDYMTVKVAHFEGKITGMATVFPGEEGAETILEKAFAKGLKGVKLHVHVQCFDLLSSDMEVIYRLCSEKNQPMVIHAGREPNSPAYACDPYRLCRADFVEEVIRSYPRLKLCVPHLGVDEFEAYRLMIETYDNLWLDTAMVITDYLPMDAMPDITRFRPDRIMYGSDFPNIPYAWDRELKVLAKSHLSKQSLKMICDHNAQVFFSISPENQKTNP